MTDKTFPQQLLKIYEAEQIQLQAKIYAHQDVIRETEKQLVEVRGKRQALEAVIKHQTSQSES